MNKLANGISNTEKEFFVSFDTGQVMTWLLDIARYKALQELSKIDANVRENKLALNVWNSSQVRHRISRGSMVGFVRPYRATGRQTLSATGPLNSQ